MTPRDDRSAKDAPPPPQKDEAEAAERYLDAWEAWHRAAARSGTPDAPQYKTPTP